MQQVPTGYLFLHMVMYMFQYYSRKSSHPLPLPLWLQSLKQSFSIPPPGFFHLYSSSLKPHHQEWPRHPLWPKAVDQASTVKASPPPTTPNSLCHHTFSGSASHHSSLAPVFPPSLKGPLLQTLLLSQPRHFLQQKCPPKPVIIITNSCLHVIWSALC